MTYTHPESGETFELDAFQLELFHELTTEFDIPEASAATIAYYADAVEPEHRIINWSKLFCGAARGAEILGMTRTNINHLADHRGKPDYWPSIEEPLGTTSTWRMWFVPRLRLLAARRA